MDEVNNPSSSGILILVPNNPFPTKVKSFQGNHRYAIVNLLVQTFWLLALGAITHFLIKGFEVSALTGLPLAIGILVFAAIGYMYIGFTNHDFRLTDESLEIVNRLPLFKKKVIFPFDQIHQVEFRHDWTGTIGRKYKPSVLGYFVREWIAPIFFPVNYKWVEVQAGKTFRFYCFGLEWDHCTNEVAFEDLFKALSEQGVKVHWTDTSDPLLALMQAEADSQSS